MMIGLGFQEGKGSMKHRLHLAALAAMAAQCVTMGPAWSQQSSPPPGGTPVQGGGRGAGRGGRGPMTPQPAPYEVHSDRTVLFRVRAPEATGVKLNGDFLQGAKDMAKGDDGTWTVTVGPLAPAVYNYTFSIDGVRDIDPNNPMVKLGDRSSESMFEVPGEQPASYDVQNVPHGTVHINWYHSASLNALRSIYVYTPPGYESAKGKLPVLYLLHGSGDTEAGWVDVGRANLILDNLIAAGKARPMMVVMPYGRPLPDVMLVASTGGRGPANATEEFGKDLLQDVIPYVEKLYRASPKPDDRAIAGLSMGGGQALAIGTSHLDTFHYIGAFSAGGGRGNPEDMYKDFFADSSVNRKLKVFYIACGKADGLFAGSQALADALEKHQIKHQFAPSEEGHVWRNWRNYLTEFAPQLFR